MPAHNVYLEPFFGSGAVLLNKAPVKIETVNDISGQVVNLFRIIREQPDALARAIYFTPWAREEFALSYIKTEDPMENARRFLVRCWMAFGAKIEGKGSWSQTIQAERRGNSRVREWRRLPEIILAVAERLAGVQIENKSAIELIKQYNYPEVLIYCDPPYPRCARSRRLYPDEMTDAEHQEFLQVLKQHSGPVVISGYENEIYNAELEGWQKETIKTRAELGKERVEVLWINRKKNALAYQGGLF